MMECNEIRSTHGNTATVARSAESHPTLAQAPDERARQADFDRRLDLALEETFPASDPVSIVCC